MSNQNVKWSNQKHIIYNTRIHTKHKAQSTHKAHQNTPKHTRNKQNKQTKKLQI